ncbi:MAG: Dam family site-specific DNA-(adenine-N6)-methyltransferase [Verrucomicrobia bacterium]|nr:Dam family site-specific DNA-(adenine-N6)-methyltransferase [Verrucomicrobiota bacterium]
MTKPSQPRNIPEHAAPFLKWAGGKRWLANTVAQLLRNPGGNYIEPFLGGGAVFFEIECQAAILSDINKELINAYRVVRDRTDELVRLLCCLEIRKSLFNRIRREGCVDPVARAARLLYLNRTAFNGLYRVNQRGEFNVPFGCKAGTRLVDRNALVICSEMLGRAVLMPGDFRNPLVFAGPNDSVFLDPPYTVKHNNNGFRQYNETIFSWNDQIALAKIANRLAALGTRVVVTNAFHHEVVALYSKRLFQPYVVKRPTTIAANRSARGVCSELVLLSDSISASEGLRRFDVPVLVPLRHGAF